MYIGPRYLVIQHCPLGGSYQWRLTPSEWSTDAEFRTRCEELEKERGGGGLAPGCGSCILESKEDQALTSTGPNSLRRMHGTNLVYLKDHLDALRDRVLDADDQLRLAVVNFEESRSLARQIYSWTMPHEGTFFTHAMIQTVLFDVLGSMVVGDIRDEPQEFLTQRLPMEPENLAAHISRLKNWPGTIMKFWEDMKKLPQREWSDESECPITSTEGRAVTSLLTCTKSLAEKIKTSGYIFNMAMAGLGMAAVFIASSNKVTLDDKKNLFDLLL